jgi:hypothetical protein
VKISVAPKTISLSHTINGGSICPGGIIIPASLETMYEQYICSAKIPREYLDKNAADHGSVNFAGRQMEINDNTPSRMDKRP